MASVIANGGLVKKVWFPREVLVVSHGHRCAVSLPIETRPARRASCSSPATWCCPGRCRSSSFWPAGDLHRLALSLALAALNVYFRDLTYSGASSASMVLLTPVVWTLDTVPTCWLDWPRGNPWERLSSPSVTCCTSFGARRPSLDAAEPLRPSSRSGSASWIFARLSPRFAEEL